MKFTSEIPPPIPNPRRQREANREGIRDVIDLVLDLNTQSRLRDIEGLAAEQNRSIVRTPHFNGHVFAEDPQRLPAFPRS